MTSLSPVVLAGIVAVVVLVVLLLLTRRGSPRRIGLDDRPPPKPHAPHVPDRAPAPRADEPAATERLLGPTALSPDDHFAIAELMAKGRKIEAIKLVRERTGLGLKEAKDFVERQDFGGGRRTGDPWGKGR